ncbi:MAG: hypothetical protein ACFFEF_04640 [Candidatus Thorarchaeota archaeon]
MGVTIFKFSFPGDSKLLVDRIHHWMNSTPEGNRYNLHKRTPGSVICLKRGMGLITAPIVFEFHIMAESEEHSDVYAIGYARAFGIGPITGLKSSLKADALTGTLPRRNGWKDMIKVIDYIGVDQYTHSFES